MKKIVLLLLIFVAPFIYPQSTDISKMTVIELKSIAFDTIRQVEILQNNLKIVVDEINKREKNNEYNKNQEYIKTHEQMKRSK